MTTLVLGASGATGRLLVEQLLQRGQHVRMIVRTPDTLPAGIKDHPNVSITQASVLALSDAEMIRLVDGCTAVASCLGHTLSWRGIYGQPRRLVTDATRRFCTAIKVHQPAKPVRFVLMNTAGNSNRDLTEQISLGQKCVIGLLRLLLPPHVDNEQAADYLRSRIGQNDTAVEWAAVRPDSLIDASEVTNYALHASPTRSAIFNAGTSSRINVAHCMAELITDDGIWNTWKGRMPVLYNQTASA